MDNLDDRQCSRWLETTLSELNEKTVAMMTILEGPNFSSRPEISDKTRLEFVEMLKDLNRFYSSLAKEHDHLRLQLNQAADAGSTTSSSCTNSYKRGLEDGSNAEVGSYNTNFNSKNLDKLAHELIPGEPRNMASQMRHEIEEIGFSRKDYANVTSNKVLPQETAGDFLEVTYDRENSWSGLKLQVTKLMEDNLLQQAELARRNVEKAAVINRLRLQLEQLKAENRALHNCIVSLNGRGKWSRVPLPKIRGPFLGKYFGGCS